MNVVEVETPSSLLQELKDLEGAQHNMTNHNNTIGDVSRPAELTNR